MATSQEQVTTRQGMSPTEIQAMVAKLVQDGQAQAKLQELFQDNFDLRGKNKDLTTRAETAESKLPKDGDLVLTGEDVALFNEAKATGKNAKQLKEVIKEHGDLSAKVTTLERKTKIHEISEAEGWKPAVVERLTTGMDLLGVEEVQEEVDDKDAEGGKKKVTVKRGFINVKGEGGTVTKKKLSEELADFMPSLTKDEGDAEQGKKTDSSVPLPRMARGDKVASAGTKDASSALIKNRYGRKKPEDK